MNVKQKKFIQTVKDYYKRHGRRSLPWRTTFNPYHILVSEVMLQQTQVERVIPKYTAFLKRFPTAKKLAEAPLSEVLILWQGLGYNRRAKMLHQSAQTIVKEHKGIFPQTLKELEALPGVGPYTASAVMAFAFNTPTVMIETNIRAVYLHHFFKDDVEVSDHDILRYIRRTNDTKHPREWYYALMDYGSYLKKEHGNPNTKSARYTKQSTFKGSDRQIRGAIVRALSLQSYKRAELLSVLSAYEDIRVDAQIEKLLQEKMIVCDTKKYRLGE